jgi:hypothetical protein
VSENEESFINVVVEDVSDNDDADDADDDDYVVVKVNHYIDEIQKGGKKNFLQEGKHKSKLYFYVLMNFDFTPFSFSAAHNSTEIESCVNVKKN